MKELLSIAEQIAARLVARKQTIAVAESSTGGLISAALLAVPGASAYFKGSAVVYTREARRILMDIPDEAMKASAPPPRLTPNYWPSRCGRVLPPIGPCRKPARPVPPATATAMPPAIAASRLPGWRRA